MKQIKGNNWYDMIMGNCVITICSNFRKSPIRFVLYSPNDYYYYQMHRVSVLIEYRGKIYRAEKGGNDTIDKEFIKESIKKENLTHIHDFETLDSYVERVRKSNGGEGRIICEIKRMR